MNYIYGYRNKITNKWYIGQTTQPIKYRHQQHIYSSTHPNDKDYNSLFHKKIREYGINNFEFICLEEVEDKTLLDEKEQYWIREKNSFVKNNGYNLTIGGQKRASHELFNDTRSSFNEESIQQVIKLIKNNKISLSDIAKQYNVSVSLICEINSGKKYHQDLEIYPLRLYKHSKITKEEVDIIIDLLQANQSNKEIADLLGIDSDVVYRINTGRAHKRQLDYPIRKELSAKEKRANEIKILLQENKLNNREIAELYHCDPSVVSNINYGKAYKDNSLQYPLRPKS